jgi:hypothetical protein
MTAWYREFTIVWPSSIRVLGMSILSASYNLSSSYLCNIPFSISSHKSEGQAVA